jgi:hypothetical protein
MKKKLAYATVPVMLMLFMTTLAFAISGAYSVTEAPGEELDVRIWSNGDRGSGSIIDTSEGRTSYRLRQRNGDWTARTQVGRTRSGYEPVTVTYDEVAGTVSIPELGIVANVIAR